jgi:hypothetical protein
MRVSGKAKCEGRNGLLPTKTVSVELAKRDGRKIIPPEEIASNSSATDTKSR